MDSLHAHVAQLIGDIIIGKTYGLAIVDPYHTGIGGREVVFLMDNSLGRLQYLGYLTEGHFRIPTVELAHNPLSTFGITRYNADARRQVDPGKHIADALINGKRPLIVKATQVDKAGVEATVLQYVRQVKGRMCFANGRQY